MNDSTAVKSPNNQLATLIFMILTDSHSGICNKAILNAAVTANMTFDGALAVLIERVISNEFEIRCRSDAVAQN
jgi:hypothetical protein